MEFTQLEVAKLEEKRISRTINLKLEMLSKIVRSPEREAVDAEVLRREELKTAKAKERSSGLIDKLKVDAAFAEAVNLPA